MPKKKHDLINTKEAAKILGMTTAGAYNVLGKSDHQREKTEGFKANYYYRCRVEEIAKKRAKKQAKKEKKLEKERMERALNKNIIRLPTKNRRCDCGRLFISIKGSSQCKVCLNGIDDDDPFDVKIKAKKQTRKCPQCGGVLWSGEYLCRKCKPQHWAEDDLDEGVAYGSILLP